MQQWRSYYNEINLPPLEQVKKKKEEENEMLALINFDAQKGAKGRSKEMAKPILSKEGRIMATRAAAEL